MSESYAVFADDKTKEFMIGTESNIVGVESFVSDVIKIVKDWPDLIEDEKMRDGVTYKIIYDDGNSVRELNGRNKVPDNFMLLVNLIRKYEPDNQNFLLEEERRKLVGTDTSVWNF